MFEADYKASLAKIASLEQELKTAQNEKKTLELNFESAKKVLIEEKNVIDKFYLSYHKFT